MVKRGDNTGGRGSGTREHSGSWESGGKGRGPLRTASKNTQGKNGGNEAGRPTASGGPGGAAKKNTKSAAQRARDLKRLLNRAGDSLPSEDKSKLEEKLAFFEKKAGGAGRKKGRRYEYKLKAQANRKSLWKKVRITELQKVKRKVSRCRRALRILLQGGGNGKKEAKGPRGSLSLVSSSSSEDEEEGEGMESPQSEGERERRQQRGRQLLLGDGLPSAVSLSPSEGTRQPGKALRKQPEREKENNVLVDGALQLIQSLDAQRGEEQEEGRRKDPLTDTEKVEILKKMLREHLRDLEYVEHFPADRPYVALFPPGLSACLILCLCVSPCVKERSKRGEQKEHDVDLFVCLSSGFHLLF
uniref:Uncharacterized protein n=1 Tax=Chromera velia CCMP2878 TaxID=1169474 RepID=A0A0G4H4D7_9ALVE|eukprot:Cvel_24654.t1-p1 / transcript=Cvel_24654.t1 / gene=Cvel_24654 / organism=Chromera_velia_CCMP2878 / gene_product=hypothetical protein / transcript_product=hypothetical protein / location=Cvel_scaffold2695:19-2719(-) / protein_length=357 / sequence_SO=supercontig / SO=protein_coding / is_pseudo=false